MTNLKCEYNEEIGHYGQTLISILSKECIDLTNKTDLFTL
jgi:hypothetical protein